MKSIRVKEIPAFAGMTPVWDSALGVFFQRIQDDVYLRPVAVAPQREPVTDGAGLVDHEDDRQRDAVP